LLCAREWLAGIIGHKSGAKFQASNNLTALTSGISATSPTAVGLSSVAIAFSPYSFRVRLAMLRTSSLRVPTPHITATSSAQRGFEHLVSGSFSRGRFFVGKSFTRKTYCDSGLVNNQIAIHVRHRMSGSYRHRLHYSKYDFAFQQNITMDTSVAWILQATRYIEL